MQKHIAREKFVSKKKSSLQIFAQVRSQKAVLSKDKSSKMNKFTSCVRTKSTGMWKYASNDISHLSNICEITSLPHDSSL